MLEPNLSLQNMSRKCLILSHHNVPNRSRKGGKMRGKTYAPALRKNSENKLNTDFNSQLNQLHDLTSSFDRYFNHGFTKNDGRE